MLHRLLRSALSLTPFYVALLCGMVVILLTGGDPIQTYYILAREAFGGWDRLQGTMTSSTVLLFTATATAIGFRAGVFTLGAEGAFVAGGLAAAVVGSQVIDVAGPLGIVLICGSSALAGLIVAMIPAALKAFLGVDEVVSTLMFNFVAVGVVTWLVQSYFLAPTEANSATRFILPQYELPMTTLGLPIPFGFILGLLLVLLYAAFVSRTALGFEFRALSYGSLFARSIGVSNARIIFLAMLLTGAVAGLGGAVHLTGVVHRYVSGFSAGFGFTGLAIALLAQLRPTGLIVGSILLGALSSAGSTAQLFTPIPLDIINVLQGFLMIAAVIQAKPLERLRNARRQATT